MKNIVIPILIVVSVVTATLLFSRKIHHEDDDIDKIQRSLAGMTKIISDQTDLTFRNAGVPTAMHQWCRYVLAPAYLSVHHNYDTILTVCNVNSTDSILKAATNNARLLWQNKDDQYCYLLTTNK